MLSAMYTVQYSSCKWLYCCSAYEMPRDCQSPLGQWPHGLSSVLASLGCTLGLFNISRFAILSVQFGGNNDIQNKSKFILHYFAE